MTRPMCVFMAGEPGERGEGGPQTGGQHDPPGRKPAPDQGGDGEPESGPRGHGTQKRYNKKVCKRGLTVMFNMWIIN